MSLHNVKTGAVASADYVRLVVHMYSIAKIIEEKDHLPHQVLTSVRQASFRRKSQPARSY
jgi:hypothetical protein